MIEFKSGDILKDDAEAVVNTVNCVGIMGRGIALQFKNAFPENFKAYAAAVKGVVDSAYSIHLKFDYAQTAYRLIFEMDGQPWLNSKITPFKGSSTTSPFVTLATRA